MRIERPPEDKYRYDMTRQRGRELKNGISSKCAAGQHGHCTAMKCQCKCGHGLANEKGK